MAKKKTRKQGKRAARPLPENVIPASRLKAARKAAPARPPVSAPGTVTDLALQRWSRGIPIHSTQAEILEQLDLLLTVALKTLAKVHHPIGSGPGAA